MLQRLTLILLSLASTSVPLAAQIDSSLKQYFPLHIGDCWQYVRISSPPTDCEYSLSTVIGDTVMPNGKKYFVKTGSFFPSSGYDRDYVRIDDSLNVFVYTGSAECTASEYTMFRLAAQDSSLWPVCVQATPGGGHHVSVLGTYDWYYQNLDLWATTKAYSGSEIDTVSGDTTYQPLGATTYRLAKGIGIVQIVAEASGPSDLAGAIIDGILYGQITNVQDADKARSFVRRSKVEVFPNPFNQTTRVRYLVTTRGSVAIAVYDLLGRKLMSLVEEYKEPGEYQVSLDGSRFSSGIYMIVLQTPSTQEQQRIVLSK